MFNAVSCIILGTLLQRSRMGQLTAVACDFFGVADTEFVTSDVIKLSVLDGSAKWFIMMTQAAIRFLE